MYSSTASVKQPLQAENPYFDKKRGVPTTTRDLQAQPLQAKSKKVKKLKKKKRSSCKVEVKSLVVVARTYGKLHPHLKDLPW